ncbi:MAG: CusA/CzcA family heavy metal efflux RND transporter [Planctomycetota bacterium]|jgi:cobalt-zinc-cadmium resistance protein CzcA|nr:CusA/CzcA family heavy metal efflux RND transporter [Planctomycetota bacterium]
MLAHVITWSLRNRWLVLLLTAVLVGFGVRAVWRMPIDAFPDTTPVMVQINATAPAYAPEAVEQQITIPIEQVVSGLPGLAEVRSISKFGLSQVVAVFDDKVDVWFARQVVGERLSEVDLPTGVNRPSLGPVATGLGEVYHYMLVGAGHSLEELTTIHDWEIRPRLLSVPGVAEVNTWGGEQREYQVVIEPDALVGYDLTIDVVEDALRRNNLTVGGGLVSSAGEAHLVQGQALTVTPEEIGAIVVTAHQGTPVRIRDLGQARIGHTIRRGAATADGHGEIVLGLAFMLMGENPQAVTAAIHERVKLIQQTLPPGVRIEPLYRRTELVDEVITTVRKNLLEGAILVIAVLFAFLGSVRAGLIVASAIPFSMLVAAEGMLHYGIAASLLSLGAIDFGLIVDSSVIMVENAASRLAGPWKGRTRLEVIRDAALEVRGPTMFGELIILVVFLPILTLEGVEGKLFRPMALTMVFALFGSMVLSLTLMPVLASFLLPNKETHGAKWLVRGVQALYRPALAAALNLRWLVVAVAITLLAAGAWMATRLGSEFIPKLSEGAITINTVRLAGVSLEESVRYGDRLEHTIRELYPNEVNHVWTRTGTAAVATDPMGLEVSDVFITLHPRAHWRRAETQSELVELMQIELGQLPGMRMIYSQPIEMRINEMTAGIRSDLGVKIFGPDLDALSQRAQQAQAILETIPGAGDVSVEQLTGQPILAVEVKQEAIARYGVPARHVLQFVEAIGGTPVGEVRIGDRRFPLTIRLPDRFRADTRALDEVLVTTETGERIPLAQLANIREIDGPATVTREWQKRRVVVSVNIRGRDLGSFVAEAEQRLAAELPLQANEYFAFGGQYEHLQRSQTRLLVVIPLALGLILILLFASTRSLRDSLIIFTGAPLATVGGLAALHLRDMPFTISAAVGFVAVSGVAMLNGLVLTATIRRRLDDGEPAFEAIHAACLQRLRPILMTALVAALGFVPMALNTGVGAEVQRPLATVVIGGVISDNILTLLVLPALYAIFTQARDKPKTERSGG